MGDNFELIKPTSNTETVKDKKLILNYIIPFNLVCMNTTYGLI
jgi:hypothetical protein